MKGQGHITLLKVQYDAVAKHGRCNYANVLTVAIFLTE